MDLSKIYAVVYENEYNKLPKWKQYAIKEDIAKKKQSGICEEFIKGVIKKAEEDYEQRATKA